MAKCYLLDDVEGWLHQTGPHHAVVDPLLRKKTRLSAVKCKLSIGSTEDLICSPHLLAVSWNGCFKLSDAVVSCQLSHSAVRTSA